MMDSQRDNYYKKVDYWLKCEPWNTVIVNISKAVNMKYRLDRLYKQHKNKEKII
jgi:hypothetical protein